MSQAADTRTTTTLVAVVGQKSVAKEVCAQVAYRRGHRVASMTQVRTAPETIDVVIIVDPRQQDWQTAIACGSPIIAMLDCEATDEIAVDTLLAGADAVLTTFDDASAVDRALDIVLAGEVMLPRALAQTVLHRLRETWRGSPAIELTVRERQILDSVARGEAIKQTARGLGITVKTVQNLQSRLFKKLGARNRAQAVTRAHDLGLSPGPQP